MTVDKLQQLYKTQAMQAESTKVEFSDNFVSNAIMIYDKILQDPGCNEVLDALEGKFSHGSCLNRAAKLKILLDKTDDLAMRRFVLNALWDNIESGQVANEQASQPSDTPSDIKKLSAFNL